MDRKITGVILDLEDGQLYIREQTADNSIKGKKIVVYDNKIQIDNRVKEFDSHNITIINLTVTDNLELGDVAYINEKEYVCLYCDKDKSVFIERGNDIKINSIHQIPSRDVYLRISRVSIDELTDIYKKFMMFKGLLKGFYLDNVEHTMQRLLHER